MRKVELLEVERAALIDLVHREIVENVIDYRRAREVFIKTSSVPNTELDGMVDMIYWRERLHMLRQLKAKLEREEE